MLPNLLSIMGRQRQALRRRGKTTLLLVLIWYIIDTSFVWSYSVKLSEIPPDYHEPQSIRQEKIFLASTHWNNEKILREYWIPAVLNLVEYWGVENIFVSIVESGSWDDTRGALHELDNKLAQVGARRNIVSNQTTHADEVSHEPEAEGWIMTPRGKTELRRIPYLSRVRNLSLQPLRELDGVGDRFDKVLFLNDVLFDVKDVTSLLRTNQGHYAAVCSLDFYEAPYIYDTFALRDIEGHEPLMLTWPYFRAKGSRSAIAHNQPVPVSSCWNGMVVMDAAPFYNSQNALQFRGIPDDLAAYHVEGSECCLIHVDNPQSQSKGIWVNPRVRVGYNNIAYQQLRPLVYNRWLSPGRIFLKMWENRIRRWFTSAWLKENMIRRRVSAWSSGASHRVEHGLLCLVNEMQVIIATGWAHV